MNENPETTPKRICSKAMNRKQGMEIQDTDTLSFHKFTALSLNSSEKLESRIAVGNVSFNTGRPASKNRIQEKYEDHLRLG